MVPIRDLSVAAWWWTADARINPAGLDYCTL